MNINIPAHWQQPKYSLGQEIEDGIIIGFEYYPENSRIAHALGAGWRYSILPHILDDIEDIVYLDESEIEPTETELTTVNN